jgi:hypothetical protein
VFGVFGTGILRPRTGHLLTAFPAGGRSDPEAIWKSSARAWYSVVVAVETSARMVDLLGSCGAATVAHPGGDLLTHLIRTEQILRSWDEDDDICLAGLAHALYGTAGFAVELLPRTSRPIARAVLGDRAEALVYLYCSCDRAATYPALTSSPVVFTDRFAHRSGVIGADEMHAFAAITIANELDLVREGAFDIATVVEIDDLFAKLAPFARDAAAAARAEVRERYDV